AVLAVGLERVEHRHDPGHVRIVPADHQPVAVHQPPDPAGDPTVDKVNPGLAEHLRVLLIVGVARIATVDDQVAGLEQAHELGDLLPDRRTGGDHEPHGSRRGQPLDEFGHAGHVAALWMVVVADHVVSRTAQPFCHVAAHFAQTDHADLHRALTLVG